MRYEISPDWEGYTKSVPCEQSANNAAMFGYAEGEIISGPFGSLEKRFSQEDGFRVWFHSFDVQRPLQLNLLTIEPTASLIYVLEGDVCLRIRNVALVMAQAGFYNMIYMPAGELPLYFPKGKHTVIQLELSKELLDGIALKHFDMFEVWYQLGEASEQGFMQAASPLSEKVKDELKRMSACRMEEEERRLHQYARFIDLWLLYVDHLTAGSLVKNKGGYHFTADDYEAVLAAGNMKLDNIDENMPVTEMANVAFLNQKKFQKGFKEVFGLNPRDWSLERKMQQAADMLKGTRKSVLEVAIAVGYTNPSTLITNFKRTYGMTPAVYRKAGN
jgi:AraC-like DNA-binding protein